MLTDYFLNHGLSFFASGWTQFAGGFFVAFIILLLLGRPFINAMHILQKKGQPYLGRLLAMHNSLSLETEYQSYDITSFSKYLLCFFI